MASGDTSLPAHIFTVLEEAHHIASFDALNGLFAPAFRRLGFEYFCACEYVRIDRNDQLEVLFGRPDEAWVRHYKAQGLAGIDPRLRHMLRSVEPALLSELAPARQQAAAARRFLDDIRTFGHADSYVWPLHLPEGRVRSILLTGSGAPLPAEKRVAAGALANGYYAVGARLLRTIRDGVPHRVELLPRQLECLAWVGQGKSSVDTGRILGISARTVDEHVAHACARLGVRTRVQAVARAILLGIL
jgi:DNA-binding CsgD family transcriptional regulator